MKPNTDNNSEPITKSDEVKGRMQRLVMLFWDDSRGGGGWVNESDQDNHVSKCVTAGFLIDETDEHLTITSSITEGEDQQYLDPITIPISCITKREETPWDTI